GPIGLMALQMAHLGSPGELWMVGTRRDEGRLATARTLGATRTVLAEEGPVDQVLSYGDGFGAHLVIDCTGISGVTGDCLQMVRPLGQITKIGWGKDPVDVSLDPLVAKAAKLQGSFSHNWKTWERVLALYASGKVKTAPLRRVFPL